MNAFLVKAGVLGIAGVLSVSGSWSVMAAGPSDAVPAAAGGHKLLRTYIIAGSNDFGLGEGESPVGAPVTVTCNNTAGCTLVAEGMAQLSMLTATQWYLCAKVDGVPMGICPAQGLSGPQGYWAVGNWRGRTTVGLGNHVVQPVIYNSKGGASLGEYQIDIHLYKP